MNRTRIVIRPDGNNFSISVEKLDNGVRSVDSFAVASGEKMKAYPEIASSIDRAAALHTKPAPARLG